MQDSVTPPPAAASTIRPQEQARFNALAATWWDPLGPMRPLHAVNALRLDAVVALVRQHAGRVPSPAQPGQAASQGPAGRTPPQDLAGLRVLDVGCGAGLMSEPLAQRGAQVVGIDAAARNVAIARQHAQGQGLALDYRVGEPASALAAEERFDVLLLLEVVEHVADVPAFVAAATRHLAPGGLVIASTINRTAASFALAIVGAEWVLRLLPRGTHRWSQFVRPDELAAAMSASGLCQQTVRGMRYNPVRHHAAWCRSTRVNYMASYHAATPSAAGPDRDLAFQPPPPALEHSR